MDKSDELETALVDSYITAKTQSQSDATAQSDTDAEAKDDEQKMCIRDSYTILHKHHVFAPAAVSVQTWKEWPERGHKDDDQAS